ncbi:MAG: DoxX family protein [Schleiferiaceae bacterium]|jgi:uncharacterized membrane protein YphA (DoxX/SURF4 family)|nr:DoxX family protein [Schleiferiaceae bacterium]
MLKLYARSVQLLSPAKDLSLLSMRLLLAYVFLYPALQKWENMEGTIWWFESLGIPFPELNAYLSATIEILGVVLLVLGLLSRFISIPLIVTMLVAIKTVHIDHGWFTIGQSALNEEVAKRLNKGREILQEYGNYDWLTEEGSFVILQNGLENPLTYISMLLVVIAFGSGRLSLDYFLFERKIKM